MIRKIGFLVVAVTLALVAQRASAQATGSYDPATGNIKLSGLGPTFSIRIFSAGGHLIPGVGNDLGFSLTEKTAGLYSWLTFGPAVNGAVTLDLGNIVTPQTPVADISGDFAGPLLTSELRPISFVPEPTTVGLAGLGLIGLASRRRRA